MPAPCSGGGTGVAKPGFAALQYIAPGAIGGALASLSGWEGLLVGAAIGALTYDLSTFCPGGPPTPVAMTATDVLQLLNPGSGSGYFTALQKFQDFLGVVFWPILCECSGGAVAVPPPQAYPVGAPVALPPPSPTGVGGFYPMLDSQTKAFALGCGSPVPPVGWQLPSFDDSAWVQSVGPTISNRWNILGSNRYGSGSPQAAAMHLFDPQQTNAPAVPPAHNCEQWLLRWTFTLGNESSANPPYFIDSQTNSGGGWSTGTVFVNGHGGGAVFNDASWQAALPFLIRGGRNTIALWVNSGNTGSANTWGTIGSVTVALDYTGNVPAGAGSPCCPPDAATQATLNAILELVTLLQRQAAPFGYVLGAVHPGLTGAGSISIQGLLGAKVQITTDSTTLGVAGTSPSELFNRGWITFATVDGALHSTRLEHPSQLIMPCDAGIYTTLYYDLNPLITVTISEIVREA